MRWIACLVFLATSSATTALACACCDGRETRTVLGWSESGRSALVRWETQACDDHAALEVWQANRSTPRACFDLLTEPDRRIACSEVSEGSEVSEAYPAPRRTSTRPSYYPKSATRVHDRDVRATARPARRMPDEEPYATPMVLEVALRTPRGFVPIFEGRFYASRPETYDEPMAYVYSNLPFAVEVWPSPDGARALVRVAGHDTAPGMGRWPATLHWAELPSDAYLTPASGRAHTYALTESVDRPRRVRAARTITAFGDRRFAHGDVAGAAHDYATALTANPQNAAALRGMARAHAASGAPELALDTLRRLLAHDPDGVVDAATDDDFAALRHAPAFWVLVDRAAPLAAAQALAAGGNEAPR